MLREVQFGSRVEGSQYHNVIPGNVVTSCEGVMGRSRFYSVCCLVSSVLQSVATFVLLHSVDEGSVGLSVVCIGVVPTGNLVNGVGSKLGRRSSLRFGE